MPFLLHRTTGIVADVANRIQYTGSQEQHHDDIVGCITQLQALAIHNAASTLDTFDVYMRVYYRFLLVFDGQ